MSLFYQREKSKHCITEGLQKDFNKRAHNISIPPLIYIDEQTFVDNNSTKTDNIDCGSNNLFDEVCDTKTCRFCACRSLNSANIFQPTLVEMIKFCSLIELSTDDEMPSQICSVCMDNLAKVYTFKKKIVECDKLFRTNLKKNRNTINILDIAFNEAKIMDQSNDVSQMGEAVLQHTSGSPLMDNIIMENLQIELTSENKQKEPENIWSFNKDQEIPEQNTIMTTDVKQMELMINSSEKNISISVDELGITKLTDVKVELSEDCCQGQKHLLTQSQSEKVGVAENVKEHIELYNNVSSNKFILPSFIPIIGQEFLRNEIRTTLIEDPPPLVPLNHAADENILSTDITKDTPGNSSECDEKFNNFHLLKSHEEKCIVSKPLVCNICKKEYNERKKLIGHLKGHMISKDFVCKICGKKYPSPSTFKIHMRSHTGERPFKCSICGKGFTRWAGVASHMQTHDDHRPFKCETCNKSFKILSNLERHKVLHSGVLPFCCNYCGKTFSQSDNLQLHIRTYHTNERPYLCSECGKSFVSLTRLKRHMWVHTGFKPFPCKMCSKAYSNSSDLKNHERSAHGNSENEKPFACNQCSMRFFHPCRLSKHKKTHQRPFVCNHCDKTFGSGILLDKHVASKHSAS